MTELDVEGLFALLASGSTASDGEPVDLLAHALQCAEILAEHAPDDIELQIAGLVHDLGTILEPDRPATHASTGAHAVRPLLGDRVAALVERHDEAKRYLVTVDAGYRGRLSPRSVETLADQGGVLDHLARTEFEASPDFDASVMLRRADDAAKVPGAVTSTLDAWRPRVEALASRRA